jgi:ABC-type branched-subunit amino acid transport system ATPase component
MHVTGPPESPILFETSSVGVRYGGVAALVDVNVRVHIGEAVGLIGANGAGKTTLIDTVSGYVRPSFGSVRLGGRDVTRLPPHRRARLGLGRTFQSIESFGPLTVGQNVRVAAEATSSAGRRIVRRADLDRRIEEVLADVGIEGLRDAYPDDLPYGQQKLAALATALVRQPKVLLLDEPAAGLDGTATEALLVAMRRIVDRGIGLLLVDHDMDVVFAACRRLYVLDAGIIIAEGSPAEIRTDPRVTAAYLGTPHAAAARLSS